LQALWCWRQQQGEKVAIESLTDRFVQLNSAESAEPDADNARRYRDWQGVQDALSKALRPVFRQHRQLISA